MKRTLAAVLAAILCFTTLYTGVIFADENAEGSAGTGQDAGVTVSEEDLWATSEAYRRVYFTDLLDDGKLETASAMTEVALQKHNKGNGVMLSGPAEQITAGRIRLTDPFDFDENAVGRISVDGLSDKPFKAALDIYLDNDAEPYASIPLKKQMGKKGWTREGDVTSVVLGKDIKGKHEVSLGFTISGLEAGASADVLIRSIEFAESSIPVMYFDIDESEGSIDTMNSSEDHDAECYGKASLLVPDFYKDKSEHTDSELTDMTDMELEYIRGRGNSTWFADKKPYKVKFAEKQDLLGMGANKHWVLLANRYDNSLVRNRMTYWMTGEHGLDLPYSPKCTPVEVVMNGNYYGSYLLSQQIRVGKTRVDIKELDEKVADPASDKITGGYLLNLSGGDSDESSFMTSHGWYFGIESPDFSDYSESEAADAAKAAQRQYIADYVQTVEDGIFGEDFKTRDGVSYRDLLDVDSTIDFWWIQEFSANGDAYGGGSNYLYKPRNDKLYFGPLWDFDYVAWGDLDYSNDTTDGFFNTSSAWTNRLLTDPEYLQRTKDRWPDLAAVVNEVVKEGGLLDRYYDETRISQQYDVEKWDYYGEGSDYYDDGYDHYAHYGEDNGAGDNVPDEGGEEEQNSGIPEIRTYRFEIEQLRGWINRRLGWVSGNIDDLHPELYKVTFVAGGKIIAEKQYSNTDVYGTFPDAPEKKGMAFAGWYDEDDFMVYPDDCPYQNMTLTAKYIKVGKLTPESKVFFQDYDVCSWFEPDEGTTFEPDYCIMPENVAGTAIKWSSSDPEIASVDDSGAVTANKEGTVRITAKLPGAKSTSYTVTFVSDSMNDIESVSLNRKSITLATGQFTGLRAKASPSPHYNADYNWLSLDPKTASVNSYGVVTGRKPGKTTILLVETSSHTVCMCPVTVKLSEAAKIKKAKAARTKVKAKPAGGRRAKVTWKKAAGVSGYYVYRSVKKNGKYRKVRTLKKAASVKLTQKKLKKGRTYFYRVRPFTKIGKRTVAGRWSNTAKVKVR